MASEDEPVSPDEAVLRLIWVDYFKPDLAACLSDPRDALKVIAAEKRDRYAIALLPVAELSKFALTVQPAKIVEVPGHAVLPELNIVACKANRVVCKTLQKQLAEIASRMVVHRPGSPNQIQ
jgi:hypothetical protein